MSLPKAKIDRNTALKLWCDTKSDYAKEQVILGNLGLIGMVLKALNQNPQDEDLFSIGIIGLIKALDSYEPGEGFEFSSYATVVIRNEILQFFRKKTIPLSFSLDAPCNLDNGESVSYGEIIPYNRDFEEDILSIFDFQKNFRALSERNAHIIRLRIQGKTQREIADALGISKSYVSRIIKGVRAQIRA